MGSFSFGFAMFIASFLLCVLPSIVISSPSLTYGMPSVNMRDANSTCTDGKECPSVKGSICKWTVCMCKEGQAIRNAICTEVKCKGDAECENEQAQVCDVKKEKCVCNSWTKTTDGGVCDLGRLYAIYLCLILGGILLCCCCGCGIPIVYCCCINKNTKRGKRGGRSRNRSRSTNTSTNA